MLWFQSYHQGELPIFKTCGKRLIRYILAALGWGAQCEVNKEIVHPRDPKPTRWWHWLSMLSQWATNRSNSWWNQDLSTWTRDATWRRCWSLISNQWFYSCFPMGGKEHMGIEGKHRIPHNSMILQNCLAQRCIQMAPQGHTARCTCAGMQWTVVRRGSDRAIIPSGINAEKPLVWSEVAALRWHEAVDNWRIPPDWNAKVETLLIADSIQPTTSAIKARIWN